MNCFQLCVFFIGFVFGAYLSVLRFVAESPPELPSSEIRPSDSERYEKWALQAGLKTEKIDVDQYSFSRETCPGPLESQVLSEFVKITCVVFVENEDNAYAVSNTWGKRCDRLLYYSNKEVPFLDVNVFVGKNSWPFLCETIRTLIGYNWVVFVNDDIFLIPENLRFSLINYDPEQPYYFGHNSLFWGVVFNTKQTAYVLSKGAISLLAGKFNTSSECISSGKYKNNEDYLLGKHLRELGIPASDLRDDQGRHRFHYFTPDQLMAPEYEGIIQKYSKRSVFPVLQGKECCSLTSISFKGTEADKLFFYQYMLYNVKVFNKFGGLGNNHTKSTKQSDDVWKEYVLEKMGPDYDLSLMTDERYFELGILLEHERDFSYLVKMENGKLEKIEPFDRT